MKKARHNGIHPILAIAAILLVLGILAYALFSGNRQRDIIGTWVTGTAGAEMGFHCGEHGIAASINNATYQYNTWELSRDRLILGGKEFRDRLVSGFSDTLKVKRLTSKQLIVEHNGTTTSYRKTR